MPRHTKTTKKTKKHDNTQNFNYHYKLAEDIFHSITIKKEKQINDIEFSWIINKKYNTYLAYNKYLVIHFLLYCLLRFNPSENQELIQKYTLYPVNFPTKVNFKTSTTYSNYNSFNYLLYLNNFIYYLLEMNITINKCIEDSRQNRWGYNITEININNKPYYNIYFVSRSKTDLAQSVTVISNNYPKLSVDIYINNIKKFIKFNLEKLNKLNLLSGVYLFNNTRKHIGYNFENKLIKINDLYIPTCNIDINENQPIEVFMHLLRKEINFPTQDRLKILANNVLKYRNIKQLEEDLERANVSHNNFNDMMKSIKPLGFDTKNQYRKCILDVAKIVRTRFNNFTIKLLGSSTTFYSSSPQIEKTNKTFSYDKSDIDINVIPNEDFDNYKTEIETINAGKYFLTGGVYPNPLTRDFLGEEIMNNYFKKWGPQELEQFLDVYKPDINIDKTILKRHISITLSTKKDLFQYYDVIKNNQTYLPNFSTFVRKGKYISYWNENNEYITNEF